MNIKVAAFTVSEKSLITGVSPVSDKLGLATALHTRCNYGDLVLSISCHVASRGWGFLHAILCVGPSVQNCHGHVQIVDMSDELTGQSMRIT